MKVNMRIIVVFLLELILRLCESITGGDSDGLAQSMNLQIMSCKLISRHHIEEKEPKRENLLSHQSLVLNTNSIFHGCIKILQFNFTVRINHL